MGKQTIIESIKEWLAGMCWEYFLKLNNLTEEKYFKQIAEQSNSATAGVRQTVSPGDVLLAEDILKNIVDLADSGLIEPKRLDCQLNKARDLLKLW